MSADAMSAADNGPRLFPQLAAGSLGRYVLLPGDPDRVDVLTTMWKGPETINLPRGFRAATGTYDGARIAALSTGVGGPSVELILSQAVLLGADTFIRVGTGGLRAEMAPGHLVVDEAMVRLDGTSDLYVTAGFPAAESYEVTLALVEACERQSAACHVGIGATTSSFYAGEGRPAVNGYRRPSSDPLREMQAAGVINLDMEGATLFTLARVLGVRAGMVASVMANRVTGDWADDGGVERACLVASEAVCVLTAWDARVSAVGKARYSPGLESRSQADPQATTRQ